MRIAQTDLLIMVVVSRDQLDSPGAPRRRAFANHSRQPIRVNCHWIQKGWTLKLLFNGLTTKLDALVGRNRRYDHCCVLAQTIRMCIFEVKRLFCTHEAKTDCEKCKFEQCGNGDWLNQWTIANSRCRFAQFGNRFESVRDTTRAQRHALALHELFSNRWSV